MDDSNIQNRPSILSEIEKRCEAVGFTMPSDLYIGILLKTLIGSKPSGRFLELGTGIGLSLAWMIDGMDDNSELITLDNDPELTDIAKEYFGNDQRVSILCIDGAEWIRNNRGEKFDLIFADAWPGKYSELDETLEMLKVGGLYVIDDMNPAPNWPEGHQEKANHLVQNLEQRENLTLTKMNWSTGVIVAVRKF